MNAEQYNQYVNLLADRGRFGDTLMSHLSPTEAAFLKAMGGSGTINPYTGMREFFSDSDSDGVDSDHGGTGIDSNTDGVDSDHGGTGIESDYDNVDSDHGGTGIVSDYDNVDSDHGGTGIVSDQDEIDTDHGGMGIPSEVDDKENSKGDKESGGKAKGVFDTIFSTLNFLETLSKGPLGLVDIVTDQLTKGNPNASKTAGLMTGALAGGIAGGPFGMGLGALGAGLAGGFPTMTEDEYAAQVAANNIQHDLDVSRGNMEMDSNSYYYTPGGAVLGDQPMASAIGTNNVTSQADYIRSLLRRSGINLANYR